MKRHWVWIFFLGFAAMICATSNVLAASAIAINHATIDPVNSELILSGVNFDGFGQPVVTVGDTLLSNCLVSTTEIECSLNGTPAISGGTWKVKVSAGNSPQANSEIDVFNSAGIVTYGCVPGDSVECYSGSPETRNIGECKTGYRSCGSNGEWTNCIGEILPQPEQCFSQQDEDCDGKSDLDDPDCSVAIPYVVINEIDYDQPDTDTAEFVEIKNNGNTAVDLAGLTIELINGNGGGATVYQTIDLSGHTLAAGGYFVVCANAATVANCDLDVTPDTDLMQNGAPDAVGLRFYGTLIDTVSYEGDTGAPYTEESGVTSEDIGTGSISRCPDGTDTDWNDGDFIFTEQITPGTANACG